MKKFKQKSVVFVLAFLCAVLLGAALIPLLAQGIKRAFAATSNGNVYSNANTYNATVTTEQEIIDGTTYTYSLATYDLSNKRTDVKVSTAAPQVTFITHGLGGNASHWSNGGTDSLAKAEGSIVELLKEATECNVYLADFRGDNNTFNLQLLKSDCTIDKYMPNNKIVDNTKHTVVLFQAYQPSASNDFVYAQFDYMASTIITNLRELDVNHELPRVNLIGHSRGGLTNLQYALDHPDLVDSIFSLGTPYYGSTSAEIDNFLLGGIATGNSNGEGDIVNSNVYLSYKNRWNNDYDRLYLKIKVHAIGSYQSLDMLIYELLYNVLQPNDFLNGTVKVALNAVNHLLALNPFTGIGSKVNKAAKLADAVMDTLFFFFPKLKNQQNWVGGVIGIFKIVLQEIDYNWKTVSYDLKNDGLVNLTSQLGLDNNGKNGYKGFNRYEQRFGIWDIKGDDDKAGIDMNKKSMPGMPAVTHNLEAMDAGLLNIIMGAIKVSGNVNGSPYLYRTEQGDNVTITGYRGSVSGDTLQIPETLYVVEDGKSKTKTVTGIGYRAFSGNMNGRVGIKHVTVPKTVTNIEMSAFANNAYLQSVTFPNGCALTKIGAGAFADCDALLRWSTTVNGRIEIPSTVKNIFANAFRGASNINTVSIPSSVIHIDEGAFAQILKLTSISVNSANVNYMSSGGNLYHKDGWLNQYAIGKTETSFTIPTSVSGTNIETVGAYAFAGASKLQSIGFANVNAVSQYAFAGCSALSSFTGGAQMQYIAPDALLDCNLFDDNEEFQAVGEFLYRYNGNASELAASDFPNGIKKIGASAFLGSEKLTQIELPMGINYIGENAFAHCSNRIKVQYLNYGLPYIHSDAFAMASNGVDFYCAKRLIDNMTGNEDWRNENVTVKPIKTLAHFIDANETLTFYYGELTPVAPQRSSTKYFKNWYEIVNGNTTDNKLTTYRWERTDDEVTYRAEAMAIERYDLTFYLGIGTSEVVGGCQVSIGDTVCFEKTRYCINGIWYNYNGAQKMQNCFYSGQLVSNSEEQVCAFKGWEVQISGNPIIFNQEYQWLTYHGDNSVSVIAVWEPKTYPCYMYYNDGTGKVETYTYNYFKEDKLPTPTRSGYHFMGWKNGDQLVESCYGKIGSLTLNANWSKIYTVTLVSNAHLIRTTSRRGIIGQPIPLPQLSSGYYHVDNWSGYKAGSSYYIVGDITLYAQWVGNTYDVKFENLYDTEQGKYPNFAQRTGTTYVYGKGLDLTNMEPYFSAVGTSRQLIFRGFYRDAKFTQRCTAIGATEHGTVTLYAKWNMIRDMFGLSFSSDQVITDAGFDKNYSTTCYIGFSSSYNINHLKSMGFTKLVFQIQVRFREIDDGDQHIRMSLKKSSGNQIIYDSGAFDLSDGKNPNYVTFISPLITVDLSAVDGVDRLLLEFDGSGRWDDDWGISDIRVGIQAVVDASDAYSMNESGNFVY